MTKTPEQIREEVKRQPPYEMYEAVTAEFRKYMIKELAANSAKGDREGEDGWLGCDNKFWVSELYYHVGKLQSAVMNNDVERVKENTADIANLAMMVLDNWIGLAPIPFIAACNWLQSEQGEEAKPEWREREVIEGKSGRWMWHPTFANGKPAQLFILDTPTPPQGRPTKPPS
jgi:hypothetical protein